MNLAVSKLIIDDSGEWSFNFEHIHDTTVNYTRNLLTSEGYDSNSYLLEVILELITN